MACSATAAEPFQASDGVDECRMHQMLRSQCRCSAPLATGARAYLGCVELIRDAVCPCCGGEVLLNLTAEGVLEVHIMWLMHAAI